MQLRTILFSCSKKDEFHPSYDHKDSCNKTEFTYDDFKINDLELNERAYTNAKTKLKLPTLKDGNNILLYKYKNKLNHHPIRIKQFKILRKISGFQYFKEMADKFVKDTNS